MLVRVPQPCIKPLSSSICFSLLLPPRPRRHPGLPEIGCRTAKEFTRKEESPTLTAISDTETRTGIWTTQRTLHARCVHKKQKGIIVRGCLRAPQTTASVTRRRPPLACSLADAFVNSHSTCRKTTPLRAREKSARKKRWHRMKVVQHFVEVGRYYIYIHRYSVRSRSNPSFGREREKPTIPPP